MYESRNDMFEAVLENIHDRAKWERRQGLYYQMRHDGLRRKNKPFPGASDLHFPLIDTSIAKLKPFYYQQITGRDTLCSFVPMRQQLAPLTTAVERWFDYHIKEKSNFQEEALTWIDHMLMTGHSVIKVFWDDDNKRCKFEAVDPLYWIVPDYTSKLEEADWMVQIMPMSVSAYLRDERYDHSVIDKIRGDGRDENTNSTYRDNEKFMREGLTYSDNDEMVIVWEHWKRDEDGSWMVCTYSPVLPDHDLRPVMKLPYRHGDAPFVDAAYEMKDKGWYSSRGIPELVAPEEAYLNKLMNGKADSITFYNSPMFRSERDIPNSSNIRFRPGQILPYGLQPVGMPQPPISWEQEIVQTRMIAEQRLAMPDFGMGQMINTRERRTATEVNAIGGMMERSVDLRARIFRLALARVYRQAYSLYLQYSPQNLMFRYLEDATSLQADALHDDYTIEPKGGVDGVDRTMLMQRAIMRKQLMAQSPWIDQIELDKSILELDDPSLVKRLVRDPQFKAADEAEDEAHNIPIMERGYTPVPNQGDSAAERLPVLLDYINRMSQQGQQFPPEAQQAFVSRINTLLEQLEQIDPNSARQLRKQLDDAYSRDTQAGADPNGQAVAMGQPAQMGAG
tara:strand:+ start:337 stop:2199 length:1863 start_codon:yes stop_codon:yes gene_type:complete